MPNSIQYTAEDTTNTDNTRSGIAPGPQAVITVDKNNFITIAGTQTALWSQNVTIKLINGVTETEYRLDGFVSGPLATSTGVKFVTLGPFPAVVKLNLYFRAKPAGQRDYIMSQLDPDFGSLSSQLDKSYFDVYTMHSEDGGDKDFHNTTLIVSLIDTSK